MDFVSNGQKGNHDELDGYVSHFHPPSLLEETEEDMISVSFWYWHTGKYPTLSKVSLRDFSAPQSSAVSESGFSSVP